MIRLVITGIRSGHIRSMEVAMSTQDVPEATLARRLREIRERLFGRHGVPLLAEALHLPASAWRGYEAGGNIPGRVLLRFIDLSGASLRWLLTGEGEPFGEGGPAGRDRRS
jgi:hypothetical protein